MASSTKNILSSLFSLALSGCLIAYVGHRADWSQLKSQFSNLDLLWVMASVAVMWLHIVVGASRYFYVLNPKLSFFDKHCSAYVALNFYTVSMGMFLPLSGLADLVRMMVVRTRLKFSALVAFVSVVADRLIALFAIILLGVGLLPIQYEELPQQTLVQAMLMIPVICVMFLVWNTWPWRLEALSRKVRALRSLLRFIKKEIALAWVWKQFWIAVLGSLTYGLFIYFCAASLDIYLHWTLAIAVAPVVMLGQSIPITFSGWGSRELLLIWLLGRYLGGDEAAVALGIALGVMSMIAAFPGFFMIFFIKNHSVE